MTALIMRSKQSNGYDAAFMAMCAEELRVTPDRISATPYWVAKRGAQILGCAALTSLSPDCGEVHAFFIDPAHQRQGIGRALWGHLLLQARARGFRELRLDADPAAVAFYQTLGFHLEGTSPSGSIPDRTIPHMARKI
ncbi:GNAT family N-acetyltransferase [Sulfitobacter sp. S190]|uniref:GNAT family N-acetyltransferase n=1 Tax=Sulfitobacter sp. S190 TaxID=2867022 RepID=UPI0021A7D578|nr:GNAT family N-acetyltransferase [Sulfitobacter sp. S190]UWR22759.1 GNAT family N-acetyltransferase [Sulfitobacter sp. S190]